MNQSLSATKTTAASRKKPANTASNKGSKSVDSPSRKKAEKSSKVSTGVKKLSSENIVSRSEKGRKTKKIEVPLVIPSDKPKSKSKAKAEKTEAVQVELPAIMNKTTHVKVKTKLLQSFDLALNFLQTRQKRNGGFNVYRVITKGFDNPGLSHLSQKGGSVDFSSLGDQVIPALLIGRSLQHLSNHPDATYILERISGFVMQSKLAGNIWKNHRAMDGYTYCIPSDIHTTSLALTFLRDQKVQLDSPLSLLAESRNPEGLFFTYLISKWNWYRKLRCWMSYVNLKWHRVVSSMFHEVKDINTDEVSIPLNVNMLLYVRNLKEAEPIIASVIKWVELGADDSYGWYRNRFSVFKIIAECYDAGIDSLGALRDSILKTVDDSFQKDGSCNGSILDTANAICILHHFHVHDYRIARAGLWLISKQNADGSWNRQASYYHPGKDDGIIAFGSEEIVTAACLEALKTWQKTWGLSSLSQTEIPFV